MPKEASMFKSKEIGSISDSLPIFNVHTEGKTCKPSSSKCKSKAFSIRGVGTSSENFDKIIHPCPRQVDNKFSQIFKLLYIKRTKSKHTSDV